MSELEWQEEKKEKAKTVIQLDIQENNLAPSTSSELSLSLILVVFTTQLPAFVLPLTLCNATGFFPNLIILTLLIILSTYGVTSFESLDRNNQEVTNSEMVVKELGAGWGRSLRLSTTLQYTLYSLLLIYLASELLTFILFETTTDLTNHLYTFAGLVALYALVVLANQENTIFRLGRLTPVVNTAFAFYLAAASALYCQSHLASFDFSYSRM